MGACDRGVQTLLTTGGAIAAFTLMSVAVGTDFWLYSRGNCRRKGGAGENETSKKNEDVMTHSGLWRTCCLEGSLKGRCKNIDHFPENADFDHTEYMLLVRASSVFPLLSVTLLLFGGLCIAASRFYKSKNNVVLSAGIFFVSAGLSNIIGIIVYISANTGDPNQSQSKKNNYSYGWSFYFGALSFILAEMVGVLAVRIYIQNHRLERARLRPDFLKKSTLARLHPSYLYGLPPQSPSPCSSRSSEDACSPPGSPIPQQQGIPSMQPPPPGDIALYTLGRDGGKVIGLSDAAFLSPGPGETPPGDASFLHSRNCVHPDMSDSVALANRRTTPV